MERTLFTLARNLGLAFRSLLVLLLLALPGFVFESLALLLFAFHGFGLALLSLRFALNPRLFLTTTFLFGLGGGVGFRSGVFGFLGLVALKTFELFGFSLSSGRVVSFRLQSGAW